MLSFPESIPEVGAWTRLSWTLYRWFNPKKNKQHWRATAWSFSETWNFGKFVPDRERTFIALQTPKHWLSWPGQAVTSGAHGKTSASTPSFPSANWKQNMLFHLQYKHWRGTQSVFAVNKWIPCLIICTKLYTADLKFWLKVGRTDSVVHCTLKEVGGWGVSKD